MGFFDSSNFLYGEAAAETGAALSFEATFSGAFRASVATSRISAQVDFEAEFSGAISPKVYSPYISVELDFEANFTGSFNAQKRSERSLSFRAKFSGKLAPSQKLVLTDPTPILETISETAFVGNYRKQKPAKLFINNVLVDILSASLEGRNGYTGNILKINLARAVLSQLPSGASFKFQVWNGAAYVTILDDGELDGRQYSVSAQRDTLSFSTLSLLNDRLVRCPKKNLIFYDGTKITVSADEIESTPIAGGGSIVTQARNVPILTLYKLLDIAFVEGCGFSKVNRDIPDFEITRADFTVSNSYYDVVKPFVGIFETEMFERDNEIWIIDTTKPLPADFVPVMLPASSITGFTENLSSDANKIDGYELIYSGFGSERFADRVISPNKTETTGEVFDANYTETIIEETLREWFDDADRVVDSKIVKEVRTTTGSFTVFPVAIETEEYKFDRLGRSLGYTKTIEKRLPDVSIGGTPHMFLAREEKQKITYGVNPYAARQTIQKRIETTTSGLLAVDAENTAINIHGEDAPFKQDYEKVFESGNLKAEMTTEFAPVETITETFTPLPNNQVKVRIVRYDNILDKQKSSLSEVRSGDISVSNNPVQRRLVILKEGLTNSTRPGKPIPQFAVGELPLYFARPLVERKLETGTPPSGTINIPGYSESIRQGVLFGVPARDGSVFGSFLVTAYKVDIQPDSINTSVEAVRMRTGGE